MVNKNKARKNRKPVGNDNDKNTGEKG